VNTHGRFNDILQHCHMRIEVELLENHSNFPALTGNAIRRQLFQAVVANSIAHLLTIHFNEAFVDGL
jgi:hypothetical protein